MDLQSKVVTFIERTCLVAANQLVNEIMDGVIVGMKGKCK